MKITIEPDCDEEREANAKTLVYTDVRVYALVGTSFEAGIKQHPFSAVQGDHLTLLGRCCELIERLRFDMLREGLGIGGTG